mgnify:CR=1 FL=1
MTKLSVALLVCCLTRVAWGPSATAPCLSDVRWAMLAAAFVAWLALSGAACLLERATAERMPTTPSDSTGE